MEKITRETLLECVAQGRANALHEYVDKASPYDVAALLPELSDDELGKLASLLTNEDLARVLSHADDEQAARVARPVPNDRLVDAFRHMGKDDITDLLGELPVGKRKALLDLMMEDDRKVISQLLQYPTDSAGGIMTTAYIAVREDLTVAQAMTKIRDIARYTESVDTAYIVNGAGRLVGTLTLRIILTAEKGLRLSDVMKENPVCVHPEDDQEYCARLVAKYDLNALPVVNERGVILGIITVDDIIDVIIDESNEDLLELGGVNKEENINTSFWGSVRMRLPWLLVNLVTAFLASLVVKGFEGTIEKVVALSASMTIISGMGGNSATQTQSILIRQLSYGEISAKRFARAFLKEILLGIVDGGVCGLAAGVVLAIMYQNVWLGVIVVLAMIGNMVVAGVFGFLVPEVLKRLGADPAVASSIFITTATDCLGFFIFLGLATLALPLLA